jgi:acyl carrier protein
MRADDLPASRTTQDRCSAPSLIELKTFIRDVLSEIAEVPASAIADETHMGRDLDVDSLQQIELVDTVEARFDIHIKSATWRDAYTVDELASRVHGILSERRT